MPTTLMLAAPYLVDANDPRQVGSYPVDSDIFFHFCNAFKDIGWDVCLPDWQLEAGQLTLAVEPTSDRVDALMDRGCEQLTAFLDLNYVPSGDTNETDAVALTRRLLDRYGPRMRVAAFVGDSYMRDGLVEIMQACAEIADIVISPYQGTIDVLTLLGHADIAGKVHTIPCVPPRFFAGSSRAAADSARVFDACYVGSLKRPRASALRAALNIEGIKLNISTAGRVPEKNNHTRRIEDYLDIYLKSAFSICSAAVPQRVIATVHESLHVVQPPVFPGRVAESIACGCLPIYVTGCALETLPIPKTQDDFPWIGIPEDAIERDLPRVISSRRRIAPVEAFRSYHRQFLSAEAVLGPVIQRLWRNPATAPEPLAG